MVAINTDLLHDIVLYVDLHDSPNPEEDGFNVVSKLARGETAVVVSLSSHDCRSVYVIGPHGAGWTFGANLKRIK